MLCAFFFFWMFTAPSWAQPNAPQGFYPSSCRHADLPQLLSKIDSRLAQDLAGLPKVNRKFLAKEYQERADSLKSEILGENFIQDSLWTAWFQNILDEILKSNPTISAHDVTLFLSQYESPNARSVGEGTLVFNVALLPFLKNESQVAAILSHELAHFANDHGNIALHHYVNTLYSPETQKQLKNISKGKVNKTQRAIDLMKGMAYKSSRHSRFKETEADSLGFVFLSNTRYQLKEAIGVLKILDSIDQHTWPVIPYESIFNAPGFPFQDSWLENSASSGLSSQPAFHSEIFASDSMKTHPDCEHRILLAQAQYDALGQPTGGQLFIQPESNFLQLQNYAQYEVIEGLNRRGASGRALFRALVLSINKPDDSYLNGLIIKSICEISQSQRAHKLRNVLDLPDADYSDEYNRFLKFVNNLRVSDLEKMAYHYALNHWAQSSGNEGFVFAAIWSAYLAGAKESFEVWKQKYLDTYPNGAYIQYINELD